MEMIKERTPIYNNGITMHSICFVDNLKNSA